MMLPTKEQIYSNSYDCVDLIMADSKPEWIVRENQYLEALKSNQQILINLVNNPDFNQFDLSLFHQAIQEANRKISLIEAS